MDEFTSIMVWIMIAFLSINITVMWVNANSTVIKLNGMTDTIFNSTMSDRNTLETNINTNTGNYVAASPPNTSTEIPPKVEFGWNTYWNTLKNGYLGWFYLLQAIFAPIPGGTLFMWVLVPFLAIAEAVASFVILLRIALIVRGFVSI